MKKLLRTLQITVALITVLVFSGNVYSQNVISSVHLNKDIKVISNKLSSANLEKTKLTKKQDNWMTNKGYLDFNSKLTLTEVMSVCEEVIEDSGIVEEWMNDHSKWQVANQKEARNIDEESRQIEEWMFDNNFWQYKTDKQWYPVESWMTDRIFWNTVN